MNFNRTAAHRESDREADHHLNRPLLTQKEVAALLGIIHQAVADGEARALAKFRAGLEDIARDFYGYRAPGSKLKGFHQ